MPDQESTSLAALNAKVDELEQKLKFVMLENLDLINALRNALTVEPRSAFDIVDPSYGADRSLIKSRVAYEALGKIFDELYEVARK